MVRSRKRLLAILLLLSLGSVPCHAAVIHLHNDDQLSGHILRMDEEVLVLATDYAGEIHILKDKIRTIVSETPLTVLLDSGELLEGPISADGPDTLVLRSPALETTVLMKLDQVTAINPEPDRFPEWTGDITLAANLKSGNNDKSGFSVGINALRMARKNRFELGSLFRYAREGGTLSTRNAYGRLKYDLFINRKLYSYLSSEFSHDKFRDLRLRTVVGPGGGYQVWNDDTRSLGLELGIAYYNENMYQGENHSWFSGRLGANLRYRIGNVLVFTDQLVVYPKLERASDFSLRNEAALSAPLAFGWALRLVNIIEFDNSPEPGIKKADYDFLLGLQYNF